MPTSEQGQTGEQPRGPLSGILIADFSRVLAGPYATMLLAEIGRASCRERVSVKV